MKKISSIVLFYFNIVFISFSQQKEIGNLVIHNIPDFSNQNFGKLNQYQSTRAAGFAAWDTKGKGIYILTRFGETMQVHHVSGPRAYREQLTFFSDLISKVIPCGDKGFLFVKDTGGDENYQIYFSDAKTGTIQLLTDGISRNANYGAAGILWHASRGQLVYPSSKRNGADVDIYISDLKGLSSEKKILELKGGGWEPIDWSDDGKWIVLTNSISATQSTLHLFNLSSGQFEQLNPSSKVINYGSAVFTKDGQGLFFTSDEDTEFQTLRYMDLTSKKIRSVASSISWDINQLERSKNGKYIVFVTNENGYSKVHLLDTKSFRYQVLKNIPEGVITSSVKFNDEDTQLAFSISGRLPSDVYTYDLKKEKLERWTFSEVGGLHTENFVDAQLIQYPTFDSVNGKPRLIPAILYMPKIVSQKTNRFPVLINMHGGPEAQSDPKFNSFTQYLIDELGIAVIYPNIRGSFGYGKSYLELDNGYLRENSVKDIGSLLDWIEKQPNLDSKRVAVTGGSYGGFMTLACMTNYNDRLKCGIDIVGISNFVTFLENTSPYRQDLRRVEYGDERDPAMRQFLTKISPTNNIQKITKPMLIIQGKNDPRVPVSESDQMVDALEKKGNKVWYIMAKDEGHGFAKKVNKDFQNAATTLFLKEYLLKQESR